MNFEPYLLFINRKSILTNENYLNFSPRGMSVSFVHGSEIGEIFSVVNVLGTTQVETRVYPAILKFSKNINKIDWYLYNGPVQQGWTAADSWPYLQLNVINIIYSFVAVGLGSLKTPQKELKNLLLLQHERKW